MKGIGKILDVVRSYRKETKDLLRTRKSVPPEELDFKTTQTTKKDYEGLCQLTEHLENIRNAVKKGAIPLFCKLVVKTFQKGLFEAVKHHMLQGGNPTVKLDKKWMETLISIGFRDTLSWFGLQDVTQDDVLQGLNSAFQEFAQKVIDSLLDPDNHGNILDLLQKEFQVYLEKYGVTFVNQITQDNFISESESQV